MANNPHAETYKGSTTFSGPIKSGSRWLDAPSYDRATVPGTIAVKDLPNAGYVACSQSAAIQQSQYHTTVNNITLPAGSMITAMQIIVTVAFDATDDLDLNVTTNPQGLAFSFGRYAKLGAVGVYDYADDSNWTVPGWTLDYVNRWRDVSYIADVKEGESVDIVTDSGPGGASAGRAILTVSYIPGLHLLT